MVDIDHSHLPSLSYQPMSGVYLRYLYRSFYLSVTTIIDGFIIKLFEGGIIELPFSASPH
jgi:hypothetical protein